MSVGVLIPRGRRPEDEYDADRVRRALAVVLADAKRNLSRPWGGTLAARATSVRQAADLLVLHGRMRKRDRAAILRAWEPESVPALGSRNGGGAPAGRSAATPSTPRTNLRPSAEWSRTLRAALDRAGGPTVVAVHAGVAPSSGCTAWWGTAGRRVTLAVAAAVGVPPPPAWEETLPPTPRRRRPRRPAADRLRRRAELLADDPEIPPLRLARWRRGWTLRELARHAGLSLQQAYQGEAGLAGPRSALPLRVKAALEDRPQPCPKCGGTGLRPGPWEPRPCLRCRGEGLA